MRLEFFDERTRCSVLIEKRDDGRYSFDTSHIRLARTYFGERGYHVTMSESQLIAFVEALRASGVCGKFGKVSLFRSWYVEILQSPSGLKLRQVKMVNRWLIFGRMSWADLSGEAIEAMSAFVAKLTNDIAGD